LRSVVAARALGYWHADQYINFGLSRLAVPLEDRKGCCLYALSTTVQRAMYIGEEMVNILLPVLPNEAELLRPLI